MKPKKLQPIMPADDCPDFWLTDCEDLPNNVDYSSQGYIPLRGANGSTYALVTMDEDDADEDKARARALAEAYNAFQGTAHPIVINREFLRNIASILRMEGHGGIAEDIIAHIEETVNRPIPGQHLIELALHPNDVLFNNHGQEYEHESQWLCEQLPEAYHADGIEVAVLGYQLKAATPQQIILQVTVEVE